MRRLYRAARYLLPHLYRRSSNRDEGTEGFSLLLGLPSSLEGPRRDGFVLADLYVEDAIDIYPATVGADYTIRDYRITVSEAKVRSEMELIVLGIAEGLTFVD